MPLKLFKIIISVVVFCVFVITIHTHSIEILRALKNINLINSIAMFSLSSLALFLIGTQFSTISKTFGVMLGYKHGIQLTAVNTFFNILLPVKSGVAIRGYFFTKLYNSNWATYLTVVIIGQFMLMSTAFCLVALGVIFGVLDIEKIRTALNKNTVIATALFFSIGVICFYYLKNKLDNLISSIRVIQKKYLLTVTVISLAILLVWSFRLYLAYTLAETSLSFSQAIAIQSFTVISLFISITPGNIGVREGLSCLYASFFYNLSIESSLAAALLDRIFSLVTVLLIGSTSLYFVNKRLNSTIA